MRRIFVNSILVLMLFSSCASKNTHRAILILQGTFKGTFTRSSPSARYAPANVTIKFNGNTFEGESDRVNYPAICTGTFKISGNDIEFDNECMWTSDFDWSYILKEKFEFSLIGNKLEMMKTVGDITDHYSLSLQ